MMPQLSRRTFVAGSLTAGLLPSALAAADKLPTAKVFELRAPDGRAISVNEWKPQRRARGTIVFSHGALSAPSLYEAIIAPWVAAGWHVLAPLHVDSAQHPDTDKYRGLTSWKARIEDMRALSAHLGSRPWIAAGHSYGALTALTMGGAAATPPQGLLGGLSNPHVRAVLAFSPPAPIPGLITREGYAGLKVPALIQTGTADVPPAMMGGGGWQSHLAPYEAAPAGGNRYALVLEGVDHYFGGAICRYEVPGPKQLERLADTIRISGLFLEGFGEGRRSSRKQLNAAVSNALPVQLMHK